MTAAASADLFEAMVGTTFRVVGPWSPDDDAVVSGEPASDGAGERGTDDARRADVELSLRKVVRLPHGGPFEQFRLVLVGPTAAPLEQDTYVLDPPPGPLEALLLVPTEERGDERLYLASLSVPRTREGNVEP